MAASSLAIGVQGSGDPGTSLGAQPGIQTYDQFKKYNLDLLDARDDYLTFQPNVLVAFLVETGELEHVLERDGVGVRRLGGRSRTRVQASGK